MGRLGSGVRRLRSVQYRGGQTPPTVVGYGQASGHANTGEKPRKKRRLCAEIALCRVRHPPKIALPTPKLGNIEKAYGGQTTFRWRISIRLNRRHRLCRPLWTNCRGMPSFGPSRARLTRPPPRRVSTAAAITNQRFFAVMSLLSTANGALHGPISADVDK